MRLACKAHDARCIDSDKVPAPLLHFARDEDRLDMARVHQIDHGADGCEIAMS